MGKDGTETHDPDLPERLIEFMRTGWAAAPAEAAVSARPEAVNHAKRRSALAAAFPGQTLVIPSGGEKVRANDTMYRFRPGSDHVWLTGSSDPDAVLVLYPDGEAAVYVRPRSPRGSEEFF